MGVYAKAFNMPQIRLLLVDNNPYFAERVQSVLDSEREIRIVAHTTQSHDILALCAENAPHIIIIGQVDNDSLTIIRAVRSHYPDIRIIALASQIDTQHARLHLKAGVTGYLLKHDIFASLSDSIFTAHQGKAVISSDVTRALL
jgi:DNA-binding NarL/FixJ family response regulator